MTSSRTAGTSASSRREPFPAFVALGRGPLLKTPGYWLVFASKAAEPRHGVEKVTFKAGHKFSPLYAKVAAPVYLNEPHCIAGRAGAWETFPGARRSSRDRAALSKHFRAGEKRLEVLKQGFLPRCVGRGGSRSLRRGCRRWGTPTHLLFFLVKE